MNRPKNVLNLLSLSQRYTQDKPSFVCRKAVYTAIPFHYGTDTAHADTVSGYIRDRDTLFKDNILPTGIGKLYEKRTVLFICGDLYGALHPLFFLFLADM